MSAPNRVLVWRELSKTANQYFTFLSLAGTRSLLVYLNDRLAAGYALNGDSPVIAPDYKYRTGRGQNNGKQFLPARQISKVIRETFRPRFGWRPYILRAYFNTQLLIAESRGKMANDFRVFLMGHKGTMDARYTTNKGVLPEVMMAEMRNAFARSEELLDLEVAPPVDPVLEQKLEIQRAVHEARPVEVGLMLETVRTNKMAAIGKTGRLNA